VVIHKAGPRQAPRASVPLAGLVASVIASTVGGLRTVALLLAPASQAGSATPSRRSALLRVPELLNHKLVQRHERPLGHRPDQVPRSETTVTSCVSVSDKAILQGSSRKDARTDSTSVADGQRLGFDSSSPEAAWQPVGGRRGRDGSAVDPLSFTRECTRGVPAPCGADQRLSGLGWAVLSHGDELGVATWVSSPQAVRSSGRTRAARTPCLRCE
jgi:hypothetical protein